MTKFKNITTEEIVEANNFTELFAFSHNSNFIKLEEKNKTKEPTEKSKNKKTKEPTEKSKELEENNEVANIENTIETSVE